MKQKLTIPLTPEDFKGVEMKIGINQDEFCPYCNVELKTKDKIPFAPDIFYKCRKCGKEFKKTKYEDFGIGKNYFVLEEIRG